MPLPKWPPLQKQRPQPLPRMTLVVARSKWKVTPPRRRPEGLGALGLLHVRQDLHRWREGG